jgi:hypothetical protein
MNKDSTAFEEIPGGISLRRIKKRAMSYARMETRKKHLGKAALIPLAIVICLTCLSVFAVTNRWGLFFSNTKLLEQNNAANMIGESQYAGDYKITLEEAAFSNSTGIIMLSLERTDGAKLHPNIHLDIDVPHYKNISGSQTSRLLEDGRKLLICQTIDYEDGNVPDTLEFSVVTISSMPASKFIADWAVSSIYSEDFRNTIAEMDISKFDEMYGLASRYTIEGVQIIEVFAACHVDDRLVLVYKDEPVKKNALQRTEFLMALYDARTGAFCREEAYESLSRENGPDYFMYSYSGINEQDLDHLFPVVACVSFEPPVQANIGFEVNINAKLEEASYTDGFHPIAETGGLDIESIKISPLGLVLSAASDGSIDINSALASDIYCLMEDGAKLKLEFTSASITSESRFRYRMNFTICDILLDAEKVKAVYINDQLFWSK